MNENIRKLAEEAKLGGAQFEDGVRYYVATDQTFAQFAVLIVQECVTIADEYEGAGATIVSRIKQHFGVE